MVKAALKKTNGRISLAAAKLNMSRQALHHRVNRNPELRTFIADLDELIIDTAENVIFTAVKNGSDVNARFLLQQKARNRGYGNRLEREDTPPPDPDAEAKRANAMKVVGRHHRGARALESAAAVRQAAADGQARDYRARGRRRTWVRSTR